jgi:transcriptional/translational regulatory protein YebC/TACO1
MSFINFSASPRFSPTLVAGSLEQGFISFASGDEDQIMEVALDAGAQDVISNDDGRLTALSMVSRFILAAKALSITILREGLFSMTPPPALKPRQPVQVQIVNLVHIANGWQ